MTVDDDNSLLSPVSSELKFKKREILKRWKLGRLIVDSICDTRLIKLMGYIYIEVKIPFFVISEKV